MSPEQLDELGWNTPLPTTLAAAVDALEDVAKAQGLDDLGVEFLKMYIDFKRLEAQNIGEKTEKDRLDQFLNVF